jgi:hypothetical protein
MEQVAAFLAFFVGLVLVIDQLKMFSIDANLKKILEILEREKR